MKLGVCLFVALVAFFSVTNAQVGPRSLAASWSGLNTTIITGGMRLEKKPYGEGWNPAFEKPYIPTNDVMVSTLDSTFLYIPMNVPRIGHSLHLYTPEGDDFGVLIAFGGNYGWEWFDGVNWNWESLPEEVTPREFHAAAIIEDELFIYGGEAPDGTVLGDMWVLSLITLEWRRIATLQPRLGHSMHYLNGFLMIYGGSNEYLEVYGDVVQFNLETGKTSVVEFPDCEKSPSPRVFHSSTAYAEGFLMYGGSSVLGSGRVLDDLWYFNPAEGWSQIVMLAAWAHPPGKWGSAFTSPTSEYFVLLGGYNWEADIPGDIWIFFPEGLNQAGKDVWLQWDCWPGYEFPFCNLDCREYNYCSGHGLCLNNGTCACDAGWTGESCDLNPCDGYRGFSYEEINDILMPKSIESLFVKLDFIQDKLDWIEANLPALADECSDEQSPMEILATTSMTFLDECIDNNLVEYVYGFDYLLDCGYCGEYTKCIAGDHCENWNCVGGVPITADICRGNDDDMCIIYACDQEVGCVSSVRDCDDMNACTHDSCNPVDGKCVNTPATCDDGDCCTFDSCHPEGGCIHTPVCEDFTLCSVESCRYSDCDNQPVCSYTLVSNCYHSEGQIAGSWDNLPLILSQPETEVTAEAYLWVLVDTCTLKYQITLPPGFSNEGTHIYGLQTDGTTAGVAGTLEPSGEIESWDFCAANVKVEDLVSGQYYITAYLRSSNGSEQALRTEVTLVSP